MSNQRTTERMESGRRARVVRRQILKILLALEVIVAYSAVGFIGLKPISVALMTVPVILGAYYLGPLEGGMIGIILGTTSMWKAGACATTYVESIFSPLRSGNTLGSIFLSIGTRSIFGVFAGILFNYFRKRAKNKYWYIFFTGMLSCGLHSVLVLGTIYIVFPRMAYDTMVYPSWIVVLSSVIVLVVPVTVLILLEKLRKREKVRKIIQESEQLILDWSKRKKEKRSSIIFIAIIMFVTLLLLIHVYGRMKALLSVHQVEITQEVLQGILSIQMQLFCSMFAMFYLIYVVVLYLIRSSQIRRQEVVQLNEALQQNREYRAAIEESLKDAKSASEAKSAFLSRMSHDIRTPLNAIIGLSSIGIDDSKEHPKEQDSFKKIWSSGHYLLGLVDDILDLSRIESDAVELDLEPLNLEECIDDIYILLRKVVEEKHQTFIHRSNGVQGNELMVDELRFRQVITNLLSNAVKYTPEYGRIEIDTYCEKPVNGKVKVTIQVRDNGYGMSSEFLKIMYEPYRQENIKNESKGTGLGLAIVRNLIELMDGTIDVTSKVGEGTQFQIQLEFEAANQEKKEQNNEQLDDSVLAGKRVLLVEDNEINIEVGKTLLEKKSIQVDVARNGKEAVDFFVKNQTEFYDVILMDLFMPVMGGIEAARAIRECKKIDADTVPIIAMTANVLEQDRRMAIQAGMNAYLMKPIIPDKLYAELVRWCLIREECQNENCRGQEDRYSKAASNL